MTLVRKNKLLLITCTVLDLCKVRPFKFVASSAAFVVQPPPLIADVMSNEEEPALERDEFFEDLCCGRHPSIIRPKFYFQVLILHFIYVNCKF